MAHHHIQEMATMRILEPHWNKGLIAASIAIAFLGAFTSTQLMVQAKLSRYTAGVLVWGSLGSLVFGFCSIWCLHFVATLACELDLPIDLDAPLTVLSSLLAVLFTFCALSGDLLFKAHKRSRRRNTASLRKPSVDRGSVYSHIGSMRSLPESPRKQPSRPPLVPQKSSQTMLGPDIEARGTPPISPLDNRSSEPLLADFDARHEQTNAENASQKRPDPRTRSYTVKINPIEQEEDANFDDDRSHSEGSERLSSDISSIRRPSFGTSETESSSLGLPKFASIRSRKITTVKGKNLLMTTCRSLWAGLTLANCIKGFFWSLAITGMHYLGMLALKIPDGVCRLNPPIVVLSALISWIVCTVGAILMADMELHIGQQLLFAVIATLGVAAMHFTGMHAVSFESTLPPSSERGYPPSLAIAIASIAITTCLVANFLLAHSATISRNKLAEIVHTRKKLWSAIAQKENAEAATLARSEFIASASHEIRTPLHQLQGYSDLLSRTKLSEESRLLLYAMQDATRALSMITNNVLDWSRLEKGEAVCRPTALDVRSVCDSIIHLLPTRDEDVSVDLLIVVKPDVPATLFIDETYLSRIIMNLLSNSLKFTEQGYVQLVIGLEGDNLIAKVTDTGCGIPDAFLPELFQPFKQAQTRGAHRGTGLGLSIVLQLLSNIKGTIKTDSRYHETPGVDPGETGTVFTVEIPIQRVTDLLSSSVYRSSPVKRIAVYGMNLGRKLEGFREAWRTYDAQVESFTDMADIDSDVDCLWIDATHLHADPKLCTALEQEEKGLLVVVPYEEDRALFKLFHNSVPHNVVPIKKPLIWHKIVRAITEAQLDPDRSNQMGRLVRFASMVDVVDISPGSGVSSDEGMQLTATNGERQYPKEGYPKEVQAKECVKEAPKSAGTILLVEDNKINQRLGAKMLKTLGYEVLLADDGQQAIDKLMANDGVIDAILMDQSMPVKDGLQATREIREMEAQGTVGGTRGRRPIIAVTAVVGPRAEATCREAGTDSFLAKPLSLQRLKDTLDSFLGEAGVEE